MNIEQLIGHFRAITDTHEIRENQTATVRPWGVEIETPAVNDVTRTLDRANFGYSYDSSVTETDCRCDCSDCEHNCDCEHCDISYGYSELQHCGTCQANEAQSPIMLTALFNREQSRALLAIYENDTEEGDNGGHIHVNAIDLTARQVSAVQRSWHYIREHLTDLIGRENPYYAGDNFSVDPTELHKERNSAVNVCPWYWATNKGTSQPLSRDNIDTKSTLEFREFASTANRSLIEARASVCRALVDYIASGQATYWLHNATSAEEVLEILQPLKH